MPSTTNHRGRRLRQLRVLAAALLAGAGIAAAPVGTAVAIPTPPAPVSLCPDASSALFGPNVCVFNDTMPQAGIQHDLDAISTQQVPISAQFDSNRYAIFFEPGTYGSTTTPLIFQVGYYTEVAGLGYMPSDTTINGLIESFANDCGNRLNGNPPVLQYWCNSTTNFWRSLSNLTLNEVTNDDTPGPPNYAPAVVDPYGPYCTNSEESWSVSQGAPIRRAIINGNVVFQDYCAQGSSSNPSRDDASGGFIADSQVNGDLDFYGQQQYFTRNSQIEGANGCGTGGLWNLVYSGVTGASITPEFSGQCEQNTVVPTSPVTEETPFLYQGSNGGWQAFVPAVQRNSSGPSWSSGTEAGSSIPLGKFFVANPSTPVLKIDLALLLGQNLILEPGSYDLTSPIVVSRPNTVVLGLGFATLVPQKGNAALIALSNTGVKISGLLIDAGPVNSPVLLSVGSAGPGIGAATNPDLVSDVFFAIGGATLGKADVSFLDLAPNSIVDDMWAWRADHGNPGTVGWTTNTAATGVVVDANNVTAYGLAVEHFQKNEVVWTGQGGNVIFYQNELPYDPPSQSAWMATPSQNGYPAFDVTSNVNTFNGYGMGSYVVFLNTTATLFDAEAFEAPTRPGVQFHNTFGVWIAGSGGLSSIIDGVGGPVTSTSPGAVLPVDVPSYP